MSLTESDEDCQLRDEAIHSRTSLSSNAAATAPGSNDRLAFIGAAVCPTIEAGAWVLTVVRPVIEVDQFVAVALPSSEVSPEIAAVPLDEGEPLDKD